MLSIERVIIYMSNIIQSDLQTVNGYTDPIRTALGDISGQAIGDKDEKSTVTVNQTSHNVFFSSQMTLNLINECLTRDICHLENMANMFQKIDEEIAELEKVG